MNLNHLIIPITIAVILILILVLIACGYVKAPPDQAYIISGLKHDAKILIGRSGIRIPFFERMDRLYLGQMTVDIKTNSLFRRMISLMSTWMPLPRYGSLRPRKGSVWQQKTS